VGDKRPNQEFDTRRKKRWKSRKTVTPPFKLENLDDLLYIAWNYTGNSFDWFKLWSMIPALEELNRMVGMKAFKEQIVDMIISRLMYNTEKDGEECNHTVLVGAPGCGKSSCTTILAKIYCQMGLTKTDKVVAKRGSDFIGKWIGHSESKTEEIFEEAKGGVLLIDEAYSLGSSKGDKPTVFSKAVVDMLNQWLSENQSDTVCIIAGYETQLNESFFSINPGLSRRFTWRFKLDKYTGAELQQIFVDKLRKDGWKIQPGNMPPTYIEERKEYFPSFGGDIISYITKCKIAHNRRMFGYKNNQTLIKEDLDSAFDKYKTHKKTELHSASELLEIFQAKVRKFRWKIEDEAIDEDFFKEFEVFFVDIPKDIELFFHLCKVKHNERIGGYVETVLTLTRADIKKGMILYKDKKKGQEETSAPRGLYM